MMRAYRVLLRLYPLDVRVLYGEEMITTFEKKLKECRQQGWAASLRFCLGELTRALPDAAAERIAKLSSHPSFHGRCLPNAGVVRPPGVGEREWFYESDAKNDEPANQNPST